MMRVPWRPRIIRQSPRGPGHDALQVTGRRVTRSEEHTSELQSRLHLVCRLLLEKKKNNSHVHGPDASANATVTLATHPYRDTLSVTSERPASLLEGGQTSPVHFILLRIGTSRSP